jgi:hypothetical protein
MQAMRGGHVVASLYLAPPGWQAWYRQSA